ncbi:hypothetical protein AVEN_61007-1 [Araneus ventricosus]|uniref:Uncharacterized protein n=1 Tax=Araneus ventricosus TaxID=182803 RepID=A0A4Y2DBL3_ARAVE|nr:hypothetical protein AVEN_61007-1 [Araneus ventricosus]
MFYKAVSQNTYVGVGAQVLGLVSKVSATEIEGSSSNSNHSVDGPVYVKSDVVGQTSFLLCGAKFGTSASSGVVSHLTQVQNYGFPPGVFCRAGR